MHKQNIRQKPECEDNLYDSDWMATSTLESQGKPLEVVFIYCEIKMATRSHQHKEFVWVGGVKAGIPRCELQRPQGANKLLEF